MGAGEGKRIKIASFTEKGAFRWMLSLMASAIVLSALMGISVGRTFDMEESQVNQTSQVDTLAQEEVETGQSVAEKVAEETFVPYDFAAVVPLVDRAEDDWFADAVFIGDSRTEGLALYGGIVGATFLTYKGISVFDVVEESSMKIIFQEGEYYTVLEALALGVYEKIYISLGVNELGYPDKQDYYDAMINLIAQVRALQPDGVIYLQTVVPVNQELSKAWGMDDYVNNENVAIYNDILHEIAAVEEVLLVDIAVGLSDEEGILSADVTSDGVHFTKEWYQTWREYLLTHTVDEWWYRASLTQ